MQETHIESNHFGTESLELIVGWAFGLVTRQYFLRAEQDLTT